jgi:cell division protein FtsQ
LLLLSGSLLLVAASFAAKWWQKVWFRPIEVVSLSNKLHYADPALVKAAVAEEVKRGFFAMRVDVIRDRLMDVPWVNGVQVVRKWPNSVMLTVNEREPLGIWEAKGIIDTEGKLFFPPTLANVGALPQFNGDQKYLNSMVDTYLLILAKIKPIGLAVKSLTLMPDHGWQAMLDNGINLMLGQSELEERLHRFVIAYGSPKSSIRNSHIEVVDLRYTNGIAVGGRANGKNRE